MLCHFRYDPKTMERGPLKKTSRLPSNYTRYRQHEQRSRSDSRIEKMTSLSRRSGPREVRLACMALYTIGNGTLRSTKSQHSIPHHGITKHQSMPRETEKHFLMMIGGKHIGGLRPGGSHQHGYGMTMSGEFFCLRISHPRSGNYCVCDGNCTLTPCNKEPGTGLERLSGPGEGIRMVTRR